MNMYNFGEAFQKLGILAMGGIGTLWCRIHTDGCLYLMAHENYFRHDPNGSGKITKYIDPGVTTPPQAYPVQGSLDIIGQYFQTRANIILIKAIFYSDGDNYEHARFKQATSEIYLARLTAFDRATGRIECDIIKKGKLEEFQYSNNDFNIQKSISPILVKSSLVDEPKTQATEKHHFWWVNHKQTHLQEIDEGYIWSPKTTSSGVQNQTYTNLTLTTVGDLVFSYANGEIRAIGVVAGSHFEQHIPDHFQKLEMNWGTSGWQVPIRWQMLATPIRPGHFLNEIKDLLPEKYSPIQINGSGNQNCYLAAISSNLANVLLAKAATQNRNEIINIQDISAEVIDDQLVRELESKPIPPTEKTNLVLSRRGQGIFRSRLEIIESRCRLTHIDQKFLLIASHIKPWRHSTDFERLDGQNGFLLAPHVDKLFDQGWISFVDTGDLLIKTDEIKQVLVRWHLDPSINIGSLTDRQKQYLKFHREQIFKVGS